MPLRARCQCAPGTGRRPTIWTPRWVSRARCEFRGGNSVDCDVTGEDEESGMNSESGGNKEIGNEDSKKNEDGEKDTNRMKDESGGSAENDANYVSDENGYVSDEHGEASDKNDVNGAKDKSAEVHEAVCREH